MVALAAVIIAGVAPSNRRAFAQDNLTWATGAAFQQQLAEPIRIAWAENPLRQAIAGLSRTRKVAILIDRRVDPGQKLDISLKEMPLRSALVAIAQSRGLDVAYLGSVVYLGPSSAARSLTPIASALERSVRRLPTGTKQKFHHTAKLTWDDLATPRDLLAELAREGGVKISGFELVPHDLWAAADLPAMPLTDRLALIAVQFDLELKVVDHGRRIELSPLSDAIRRSAAAESRLPAKPATPEKSKPPTELEQTRIERISLDNLPLQSVLKYLAKRFDFELRINPQAIAAAGIPLDQRVSVHLQNVTVDELLRQLLKPTRLTFHRRDRVVEIVPAK